jgi:hypothetical protein
MQPAGNPGQLPGEPLEQLPLSGMKQQFSLGFVRMVAAAAGCSVKDHPTDYDGGDVTIASSADYERFYCPSSSCKRSAHPGLTSLSHYRKQDALGACRKRGQISADARRKLYSCRQIPLATDYADFRERFSEALTALGRINGWSPGEVEQRITAARAEESGETPS